MENSDKTVTFNLKTMLAPLAILLAGSLIAGGVYFGLKSRPENQTLGEAKPEAAAPVKEPAPQAPTEVTTSIDDDAVLGDKSKAKVAIVEFSDYECPFCARFREQTLDQIKESYIDSGQAIFVYRDLPLPFHNPAAEREAIAAECAREQGNDETYFSYHDQIFATSPGNGQGISVDGLVKIADQLGLSGAQLKTCLEQEKYKQEVARDAADAAKAGISGTPGFVVGRLAPDGTVTGKVISGAQPFSIFQSTIDEQLKQ